MLDDFTRKEILTLIGVFTFTISIFGVLLLMSNVQVVENDKREQFCIDNGYTELSQYRLFEDKGVFYIKCFVLKIVDDKIVGVNEFIEYRRE